VYVIVPPVPVLSAMDVPAVKKASAAQAMPRMLMRFICILLFAAKAMAGIFPWGG
jgi:hypothetical protein